ncbi:Chaperone protein DnaJ [Frankliniella fusca]|uniref:Chaperone protein DnaJ n=1 Tax=Frankliniella fusca TaxID=407009 RepID=A0AAE1GRY9_9NEOP|nr:Chaperone protein DnaJ [Frankliniella fusca]
MAAATHTLAALCASLCAVLLLAPGALGQATCDVCAADGWYPPSGAAAGDNCQTQYCVCYAPYTDVDATTGVNNAWLYSCPAGGGTATCFNQTTKKCTVCQACCSTTAGCPTTTT